MSYKMYSPESSEEKSARYWDGRSLDREMESFSGRTLVKVFGKYMPKPKARIIEAGCGLGAWCEWFKQKGYDVVGLEYEKGVVAEVHHIYPNSSVEVGDVAAIKYENDSFDAYVSLGVIEHFEHGPEKVLSESYRILKPGGLVFYSVPALTTLRRCITHPVRDLFFLLRGLKNGKKYFWEYRYEMKELKAFIAKAGFEILEEGVDDIDASDKNRNMGINADWFFLRSKSGKSWELNAVGKIVVKVLRLVLPETAYCCGWYVVAKKPA